MKARIFLFLLICFICSGCKTLESFYKKKEPVMVDTVPQTAEDENMWIQAKTSKVWVNPHVDDEGNLIEGHFKHVVLEEGHWALQENKPDEHKREIVTK